MKRKYRLRKPRPKKYATQEEVLEARRKAKKKWRDNNKEYYKEYYKKYQADPDNRDKVNARARRYRKNSTKPRETKNRLRKQRREQYQEYMSDKKCNRCQCSDPRVLVWHHKDRTNKKKGVCVMVQEGYSWDSILAEIAKCECLCQNCHSMEHYIDKSYKTIIKQYKTFMKTQQCNRCRKNTPGILEWHHIDPLQKEYVVSQMVIKSYEWEDIMKEISKCECLCRSCHHIETHFS